MTGGRKDYLSDDLPSRGSGGEKGSAGQEAGADLCNITSNGSLRSPNPVVVRSLQQGDRLSVEVTPVGGVEVLRAIHSSQIGAGVIDCPAEREIIQCINLGNSYQAVVLRVQGGAVSVSVSRI